MPVRGTMVHQRSFGSAMLAVIGGALCISYPESTFLLWMKQGYLADIRNLLCLRTVALSPTLVGLEGSVTPVLIYEGWRNVGKAIRVQ